MLRIALFFFILVPSFALAKKAKWFPYENVTDSFSVKVQLHGYCKRQICKRYKGNYSCEDWRISNPSVETQLNVIVVNKDHLRVDNLSHLDQCKDMRINDQISVFYDKSENAGIFNGKCNRFTNSYTKVFGKIHGLDMEFVEYSYAWGRDTIVSSRFGTTECHYVGRLPDKN